MKLNHIKYAICHKDDIALELFLNKNLISKNKGDYSFYQYLYTKSNN
jgi:hypothetical protein